MLVGGVSPMRLKQRGFLSSFHIGNYEISVLQVAVKTKGCQLIQFDKRKDIRSLAMKEISGFVIHTCGRGGRGGHWLAITLIGNAFYRIDSLLPHVIKIGNEESLFNHLAEEIKNKRTMLFCLMDEGTVYNDSWMKELKLKEKLTHCCDSRHILTRKHWIERKLGHSLRKSQKTMHIPATSSGVSQNINDESDNSSETSQKGCNLL
ncbi:josephin-1 isoform X2 [Octopus bimaculoides]|uniref:ubiquitinyl hydrolase 1 n=1 Tax=Octopus bimaculoides TaxID=37653 RepID=A0A0L8GZS0_OCTBM|nr:josephin-1 isoform X2 [Octopus bimaculoides]|eukprot:XP_014776701.1 PREDICTED: josephin-1-like isoform X2 [Octopus bimaculoides]